MRFATTLSTAALLTALLCGLASAQVISVNPDRIDFGKMKQEEAKTTEVTVTNEGAGRLIISNVKADCGCTVPEMAVKELGPGESTTMTIDFNSKKFVGSVLKTVQIESNDPTNPVVDVVILANVWTPLVVNPASQRLGFQRSSRGDVQKREATFTAMEIPELKLKVDGTKKGLFEVAVRNGVDGNPQSSVLDVTLPADMPVGQQRDMVRIETNVKEMPTIDFELRCWVTAPLYSSPEAVNLRYQNPFKQTLRVRATDQAIEFRVKKVRCDLPGVEVTFTEVLPGIEAKIEISGAPLPKEDKRAVEVEGRMKGTIFVETDAEAMPVLEIPVTYLVRM